MTYRNDAREDRSVLVVGLNGRLFGLDPATGQRRWEHQLGHGEVELIVHDGRIYALASGAAFAPTQLHCLRYPSGEKIGAATVPTGYAGRSTMLLEGDRLFVATNGELFAFTLEGTLLWRDGFQGKGLGSISLAFPDNVRQADSAGSK